MLHTFDGLKNTKNEKYVKYVITITRFNVFLIFYEARSTKSIQHGYSLDEELNFVSNYYSVSKF